MSRLGFRPEDSAHGLTSTLLEHFLAGFPPDLALDLVLNEIVVRACEAARGTSAALALVRGSEMVCRAATGLHAPDLGVPLNTRDGLSGACLRTRQPQICVDTELDRRVDPAVTRRLGVRSILIVPVFDTVDATRLAGMLEVFSSAPEAFSDKEQKLLEGIAAECARIRQEAVELTQRKPNPEGPISKEGEILSGADLRDASGLATDVTALPAFRRPLYENWALFLGGLTILSVISISLLVGSRVGWMQPSRPAVTRAVPPPAEVNPVPDSDTKPDITKPSDSRSLPTKPGAVPPTGELVVYENGKVVFRMKPGAKESDSTPPVGHTIVEASSTTKFSATPNVWLSPERAEARLLSRTEPRYPADAIASRLSGDVVLEVHVDEDGSVVDIHTLSGDALLADAAGEAIRNWRYQPYRLRDRPSRFQTEVTITFALPD